MGTNYYWIKSPCYACGRGDRLHIGKSSGGWCFALHVVPEEGINSLEDWEKRWATPGCQIVDEYDDTFSIEEMREIILDRVERATLGDEERNAPGSMWYALNFAEPGPHGLARAKVCSESRCVGHGDGTYDLILGEFS